MYRNKFFKTLLATAIAVASTSAMAAGEQSLAKEVNKEVKKEEFDLSWAGCGITKKAFVAELTKGYEKKTGLKMNIKGGGATKGIRQPAAGEADVGGACRYKIAGVGAESNSKMEPVAWDALVAIVNPKNKITDIKLDDLKKVFSGEINNWSQLGGPDKKINLYTRRSMISGVGRSIRLLMFGNEKFKFSKDEIKVKSSGPLEIAVTKDEWAIGMTGISSAKKRVPALKVLSLDGAEPSYENIAGGKYSLYRPLYLTYAANETRQDVLDFIKFAHSEKGRDIIRGQGTVPYIEAMNLVPLAIAERKDVVPYEVGADNVAKAAKKSTKKATKKSTKKSKKK